MSPVSSDLRQRQFDFLPWLFYHKATEEERKAQREYQELLAAEMNVIAGANCYLSPAAAIFADGGGGMRFGDCTYVAGGAYVTGTVSLGANCTINPYAVVRGNIRGGDGVRIASHACIMAFNHGFERTDIPVFKQPLTTKGITLGDDVWVGAHVTILDGVHVGSHTILAAGAVVTKDVPDYAIVGGNPARVLRMRTPSQDIGETGSLAADLHAFGKRVGRQIDTLLCHYMSKTDAGGPCFIDQPGARRRVRPWCDAVEIAAVFGRMVPGFELNAMTSVLRSFQDPGTGLVPEHIPDDRSHDPAPPTDPAFADRYNTMIVQYALECLGSSMLHPVRNASDISKEQLRKVLEGLSWTENSWGAGHWIDCYATCLYINGRYFNGPTLADPLFEWLDAHCDPATGMWGKWRENDRWLQPVNGFYRLTRGTYAQFGRPLPHPERAIDTILTHSADAAFFGDRRGNACNVLDVIHPLWLCLKQTSHRRAEVEAWVRERLPIVLGCWQDERGFDFDLSNPAPAPRLQGTEMWLSIIYLMADILGCADMLGYQPRGVHRLEAVAK